PRDHVRGIRELVRPASPFWSRRRRQCSRDRTSLAKRKTADASRYLCRPDPKDSRGIMGPVLPAAWLLAFLGASDCDDAQTRLQAAAQAIESMDVHGAESILEPIESLSYRCPNVMIAIGRVAFAKGDYRRASTYSE